MNKKIATRWIKALRSGKYKQGTGALCGVTDKSKRYCCLGVLTELYQQDCKQKKKKTLSVSKTGRMHGNYFVAYGSTRRHETLPDKVRKWAGLRTSTGTAETDLFGIELAYLNDNGHSFKEIARVIEKHYEHL